jgi:hypothetical protein
VAFFIHKMASNNITDFSKNTIDPYLQNQPNRRNQYNLGGRSDISDYLSRYSGFINNQESLPQMATRLGDELGLPGLRATTAGLTQSYQGMPETYSKATRGFDVNANQLNRIIGTQQAKLAPALQAATGAQSAAEQQLTERLGYGMAQQERELLPFQSEQALLNDRLAREYSGFNLDSENELNALIEKMRQGVQLSIEEQNRANQLAIAELNYKQAVEVANINKSSNIEAANINKSSDIEVAKMKRPSLSSFWS